MRVTPRSSRNALEVSPSGEIRIWVTAPPTDDQANKAVCELLAKKLGLPKSSVAIARGQTSRDKQLIASGVNQDEAIRRLRLQT